MTGEDSHVVSKLDFRALLTTELLLEAMGSAHLYQNKSIREQKEEVAGDLEAESL